MLSPRIEKKRGGRPSERDEPKRAAIALRTTPAIKEQLSDAADARGRSITQEVEARIEESFAMEALLGGPRTKELLLEIAGQIARAEAVTGQLWHEDAATFLTARHLIDDVLKRAQPRPENFEEVLKLQVEKQRVEAIRDHLATELNRWGAITPNRNALAMLQGDDLSLGFRALPEDKWHEPDDPALPLDDDFKNQIRGFVSDLMEAQETLANLTKEIEEKVVPWQVARTNGKILYKHLTNPIDWQPMEAD